MNQVFFGRLLDSQGELEFGPDAIVGEYNEEDKKIKITDILFANFIP